MLTDWLRGKPNQDPCPEAAACYCAPYRSQHSLFPQLFTSSWTPRSLIPVPSYLHHFVLNVLCQSLLQGLSNHCDLVPEERQAPSATVMEMGVKTTGTHSPALQERHGRAETFPGKGKELGKGLEHQGQLRELGESAWKKGDSGGTFCLPITP